MRLIYDQPATKTERVGYVSNNGSIYCSLCKTEGHRRVDFGSLGEIEGQNCRACLTPAEQFVPEIVTGTATVEQFECRIF